MRKRVPLITLTTGTVVLETIVIWTVGAQSSLALAPQVSAPAPYGVFHDIRWLLVYHESWLGFVLELIALLLFRTALTTALVVLAWPDDRHASPRPSWRDLARRSAVATGIGAVALLPFAVLLFAMAVVSLSWLFFVAVPVLVMVAVLVHHGVVIPRWWYDAPSRRSVGTVVLAFGALTIFGGALVACPSWLRVPLAIGAGLVNAWLWTRFVDALARHAPAPRRRPFAVVGLAAVLALVIGGTAIGFAVAVAVEGARSPVPRARANATGPPVLVVKGFNSRWEDGVTRQWVRGNYRIRRFSYRGLDDQQTPRPYERADTHRSLRALVREMRRQVDAFADATGKPVDIVAESEGSLVARTYLAATPDAPVRSLVLLSPLLSPGRVYYPPVGDEGWGAVSGLVLDGLARAVSLLGPVDVSADTPLFRSVVDQAPALRALLGCKLPGVRELAVLPLDSGTSAPPPVEFGIPHTFRPAFHGGLLGDATTARLVGRVLHGQRPHVASSWTTLGAVIQAGASPWQVPTLAVSVNPAWRHGRADASCRVARAELRAWVAG